MNERKIDLILKGINLIIIKDKDIGEDIRRDFNLEFFDIYTEKEQPPTIAERTHDAFSQKTEVNK